MRIAIFIKAALGALLVNKFRSFLTMLGIVIGVAAIVVIIAVGNGAQSLLINQISSFGSDLVGVLPGGSDDEGPPAALMGITITTLKNSDAEAIRNQVKGVAALTGYVRGAGTISWANRSVNSQFVGVHPDYPIVESADLAIGNFFTEDDNEALRNVAVLGWQVYTELFGDSDPIGQRIKIKRTSFRVIGVIEERGTVAFQNQDDQLFVPLKTTQKQLLGIEHLSVIRMKAEDGYNLDFITEDVKALLRDRHDIRGTQSDDFTVRNVASALDVLGSTTDILKYFLAAISALSLLVGGIGIMNIMLVSVLERTKELGLRKAVGARPLDLRIQFLSETIIISVIGGLAGLIIGILVSYAIAQGVRFAGFYWEFDVGTVSFVLSLIFPLFIGLIFGYYPAAKAARLKPIEALHYE